MDASPFPTPARALRWSSGMRSAGLTLLCLGLLCVPPGALAPSHAAGACRPGPSRQVYAPRSFLGYACRDDRCNSHKAGFDWAERNGIADARACTSRNDPAFAEGCRAFAEEAVTPEQAGFEWARENELEDRCHCAGAGAGFEAGCAAYVTGFAR
ncbi:MAG: hypothetical protein OEY13_02005 [Gammaproteobacteria bacterium]|nr:hypothetical protein [Gammaproteobacteria bacterium]MDH5271828.1 hypothetical protein [Gammaproteobacteria bacterium]